MCDASLRFLAIGGRTVVGHRSIEVKVGPVGIQVLINPWPGRCWRGLRPIGCAQIRPDADKLEIATKGKLVRCIQGNNREFFGMVDVVCRTGVEIFVPLARYEPVAGVEKAAVSLTGNRLSGSKIVEAP